MASIFAVAIFIIMFALIISEKIERHIVTLVSALATCVIVFGICMQSWDAFWNTINIESIFSTEFWYEAGAANKNASEALNGAGEVGAKASGINWETIVFIAGMMVMVEGMARVGFFRWLCMRIAKIVKYKTKALFVTFMIMSAVLSMFIDSITVILFLAAVTIELAKMLRFNPIPMIISEIFCANLGGSATMCGDPPNIIIGTSLGYTFFDFLQNTGVIALVSMVAMIIYFLLVFNKDLRTRGEEADIGAMPKPRDAIVDKKGFIISSIIFGFAVVLLITHATTGLTVATIGVVIAILTLISAPKHIGEMIKKVDYKTLLFFIGLFVVVGGLEQTGILELIAKFIEEIAGDNVYLMIAIIIWISAIASAFVDNIPFAATMVPVISTLAEITGVPLTTLAWSLSMGTDIGGSATPIGASANVVGISVAEKNGHKIGWGKYCMKAVPATVIVLGISTIMIFVLHV